MQRKHDSAHPIHDLLATRWSPRAFADRPVEPTKLQSLLEAARWSASCANEQPWYYLVATKDDQDGFERMLGCLVDANQRWAKDAPVLMLACASNNFLKSGKPNNHARYDLGQATAALTVEAMALGLYVHQMAGFNPDKARETYAIPEGYEAVTAIALGYMGDPQLLPDDLRQREIAPSVRKPQSQFVFSGKWGEPRAGH